MFLAWSLFCYIRRGCGCNERCIGLFFQKEKADLEKLKLILKPEEMSATVNLQTPHERMQHLEQLYQELESHYKKTIERIAAT